MYRRNTSCSEINRAGISLWETKCSLSYIGHVMSRAVHVSTLNKAPGVYFAVLQNLIECL